MFGVVDPIVLACGALAQSLDTRVRPNLVLWLNAEGVEASGASVTKWKDQSGGNYEFGPLSATQHRVASARWKTAVTRSRQERPGIQFGAARRTARGVSFPSPLVANNLQLRDGITAFFVLTPEWLLDGDQAVGQRFFGHYPYGQFRFHDGKLGFKSEDGDHLHSSDVVEGETVIAAYRFDGAVAMSLNGRPFEVSLTARKRQYPPSFSASGYVTLGGCPPHNSFVGEIAEVMVFGVALGDDEARHVAETLADRHHVQIASRTTAQELPQAHGGVQTALLPSPAVPALAELVDGGPPKRPRAEDRLPVYKKIKDERKRLRGDAAPADDLLAQLREAQAKLTQLQDAMHQHKTPDLVPAVGPPIEETACRGGDAFEKVSITRWTPPDMARLEEIQQWKAAKSKSDQAIKNFPRGGKELRGFVHDQIEALRLLRHNLFCGYQELSRFRWRV